MALLVVIGVNAQGFREVLAVESAARCFAEQKPAARRKKPTATYSKDDWTEDLRAPMRKLLQATLRVLVISDDHESIKAAVQVELPSAKWQRCIVHFERNILCHIPAADMAEVASDLTGIFAVHRKESADALAEAFVERYGKLFVKAVGVLKNGLANALTFLSFPSGHHRLLRTTNELERLFGEVKRRTRVVSIFPNETSAANAIVYLQSLHGGSSAGDGGMGVEAVSGHGIAKRNEPDRRGEKLTTQLQT